MNDEMTEGKDRRGEEGAEIVGEETVGEILLAARERSGLTLVEVGQETRIPVKNIEYLETDNFEALPAKVYIKGFLRTYAELLELDVDHILNKYEVQTGQTHKSKGDMWEIQADVVEEKLVSPDIFKRFVLPVIIFVCILVLVISYFLGRRDKRVEPPSATPAVETEERPDSMRSGETEPDDGDTRTEGMMEDRDEPETAGDAVAAIRERRDETDVSAPAPSTAETEPADAEPMELTLIANDTDTTWFDLVTVSRRDGDADSTSHDFLLFPGRRVSFRANVSFLFRKVGNAGGFEIELNGRRLPALGEKGQVVSNHVISRADLPAD